MHGSAGPALVFRTMHAAAPLEEKERATHADRDQQARARLVWQGYLQDSTVGLPPPFFSSSLHCLSWGRRPGLPTSSICRQREVDMYRVNWIGMLHYMHACMCMCMVASRTYVRVFRTCICPPRYDQGRRRIASNVSTTMSYIYGSSESSCRSSSPGVLARIVQEARGATTQERTPRHSSEQWKESSISPSVPMCPAARACMQASKRQHEPGARREQPKAGAARQVPTFCICRALGTKHGHIDEPVDRWPWPSHRPAS